MKNQPKCKQDVQLHQCRNYVWLDGYCRLHHPETRNQRELRAKKLKEERKRKKLMFLKSPVEQLV
jgi:hypothetical protein